MPDLSPSGPSESSAVVSNLPSLSQAELSAITWPDAGFWSRIFSSEGFMPRRLCGTWTPGEIWLHNASDFFIWTAYLAIPIVLLVIVTRRRADVPFRPLFFLFMLFIVACGTTHLVEIVMFYEPLYRLAGLIKLGTAAISWATVIALVPALPCALAMRSPDVLEAEVRERTSRIEELSLQKDQWLIAEQKAREEAEAARQVAEAANRAKDEFLMTLSHELRTPLNAIQGWASLLQSPDLPSDARARGLDVDVIERNAWAQAHLIDDILQVSRIITGKLTIEPRPLEFEKSVDMALLSVEPAARAKGVSLHRDFGSAPVLVNGDAERLQQVVWNLLSNAVKFTPAGGEVRVALRCESGQVILEISDTGQGIAPEFLPFVFDRFRQADSSSTRRYGGLGLGLALVRHLSELHGGQASVSSPGLGQGSTFCVSLPLYEPAPSAPKAAPRAPESVSVAPEQAPHPLSAARVLVVDDDEQALSLTENIMRLHGAQVETASSVNQAWRLLGAERFDLLISDIAMPEHDGLELIRRVRSRDDTEHLPALALTAYASDSDARAAFAAGFNAHLAKPVLPDTLLQQARDLLRSPESSSPPH